MEAPGKRQKISQPENENAKTQRSNSVQLLEQVLDGDKPNTEAGNGSPSILKATSSKYDGDAFKRKVKTIDDLPHEMLVKIFRYLDIEDLIFRVKHVSKHWAEVSQDSSVWKYISYSSFSESPSYACIQESPNYSCLWTTQPSRLSCNVPIRTVVSILEQCPKLEAFHALNRYGIDNTILKALGENCKNIKKLSLSVNSKIFGDLLWLLTDKFRHSIEELFLKLDGMTKKHKKLYNVIGKCRNLKSLTLHGIILDQGAEDIMKGIALGCPKMKEFKINYFRELGQKDLNYFLRQKGSQLHSLSLDWNSVLQEDTLYIVSKSCKKLEKLSVGKYSAMPLLLPDMYKDAKLVPNDFVALKQMFGLRELILPHLGTSYRNSFLDLFENGNLRTLTALDLSFVDCVNAELLHSICQNCRSLERLNLMGCREIDDECFLALDSLTKLRDLNIERCSEVEDKGVACIVKCKTLKYLNLKSCPKLTIKSFKMCCEGLKLYELHFDSCRINEKDLLGYPWHLTKFLGEPDPYDQLDELY